MIVMSHKIRSEKVVVFVCPQLYIIQMSSLSLLLMIKGASAFFLTRSSSISPVVFLYTEPYLLLAILSHLSRVLLRSCLTFSQPHVCGRA
jgi:hypothetical protein